MSSSRELDDILDAALDELDDESSVDSYRDRSLYPLKSTTTINDNVDSTTTSSQEQIQQPHLSTGNSSSKPFFGPPRPPVDKVDKLQENGQHSNMTQESLSETEKAVADMMRQMEHLFPSEDFGKEGSTHVNVTPTKSKETASETDVPGRGSDMNDAFSKLLRGLSADVDLDENMFPHFEGDITDEMQREWEETMKKANFGSAGNGEEGAMDHVVDGMMKQLLSKEFMYEPMKDITEKFPKWLADNKTKLKVEDYEKYGKQYQYFQRIVDLYENDPENIDRLTELMNQLQEYGQPPADIIQELAPDLELDDDGMPKIPGFHGGPDFPNNMNEECIIM